jgi:hypothetical protein
MKETNHHETFRFEFMQFERERERGIIIYLNLLLMYVESTVSELLACNDTFKKRE